MPIKFYINLNLSFLKKLLLVLVLLPTMFLSAQTELDALRFAHLNPTGSARYVGAGGAFSTLGANFSALADNPAGTALYRGSEITLTTNFLLANTTSTYLNQNTSANRFRFNFNNLGLVFTNKFENKTLKALNWAVGYNRQANFNRKTEYTAFNEFDSKVNDFIGQLNGFGISPSDLFFDEAIFFDAYLIDTVPGGNNEYGSFLQNGMIEQSYSVIESGGIDEYMVAAGANINDLIYVGAKLAIPNLNYTQISTLTETDVEDVVGDFEDFTYVENINITGGGFNAKIGVIARPTESLKIGLAIKSPTSFSFTDGFSNDLQANYTTFGNFDLQSFDGQQSIIEYQLRTPWRATVGLSSIIKRRGFISVDYHYTDYSKIEYTIDGDAQLQQRLNNIIDTAYTASHHIKVGGEWAKENFRLRAGVQQITSPIKGSNSRLNGYYDNQTMASLGTGLHYKSFYFGGALTFYISKKSATSFHEVAFINNSATTASTDFNLAITAGIKF